MKGKNLIIISFTEQGSSLNAGLHQLLSKQGYTCESYAVKRFADKYGLQTVPSDRKQWIGSLWGSVDFLFIGAIGIAVRYIAAWAEDKYKDSAVLSMDEKGKFVIPVLSGHVGGGVELAEKIASYIGAVPVITTATDVQNRFAVDVFARKNQLHIGSRELAKRISAAVLEGKKVGFYSTYPVCGEFPADFGQCRSIADLRQFEYGIAVTKQEEKTEKEMDSVLFLTPQDLVVGVGCRRGVPFQQLQECVQSVFREKNWKTEQICALVSIDLKREEQGLIDLAELYGVPFYTYSAEQLLEVGDVSSESAFVQSVTGVDNVCERAAKRCCPGGTLVLPKVKRSQVTLAAVQRNVELAY